MKEKLIQNLDSQVSFRSLHISDTNLYKGILTSVTTLNHAKLTVIDLENYHRVIKNVHHNLPDIKNLTWFVIILENKKQKTFAYEWTSDFQFISNKSKQFTVSKIGDADPEKIRKLLQDNGYTDVVIN